MQMTFQNQDRLRQNLKSLEEHGNSALVKRYLKDMSCEEDDLIRKRKEIESLEIQLKETEVTLDTILEDAKKGCRSFRTTQRIDALRKPCG